MGDLFEQIVNARSTKQVNGPNITSFLISVILSGGGGGGGGPTTFLYMATRFLPNVHVQNVQKCTKYFFSCLEVPWI